MSDVVVGPAVVIESTIAAGPGIEVGPQGPKGDKGDPGTPGTKGDTGPAGTNGTNGTNGTDGVDGKSAYEIAVEAGFVGTEAAWLDSLHGADGEDGLPGTTTWAGITDKPTIPDSADDIGAETPAGAQAKADAAEAAANAYTDTALTGVGGGGGAVDSVNGQTGVVVLDAADVSARPDTYVPTWAEVTGKPATFPAASHTHLVSEVTGLSTVATSGAYADLSGKPTIPTTPGEVGADPAGSAAAAQAAAATDATTKANTAEANAKAASTPIAHATDTTNPHAVTKAQVGLGSVDNVSAANLRDRSTHTGTQAATTITGLATVATSGAYADLSGKPTVPALTIQDENGNVATGVTQIDFQGPGVTAASGTGEVVVTIPGGGSSGDTAWTAVTFQNGWVNYDTTNYPAAGFRKDGNGFVHLRGLVKSGTFQAAIFTLPTGYRPAGNKGYPVMSNGGLGQVNINPAGVVSLNISPASSTASVFLDGITFLAEA